MTTKQYRIPLPCRYFHTAEGCPYGKACKYDHYSNNPSYFNYIKQKLHQISKPNKSNSNDIINTMMHSIQQCITQIMNKQFNGLYQEINSLKNTINHQTKLITKNNQKMNDKNKHLSESALTKQFNKITKLLKTNHSLLISNNKYTINNDDELTEICTKLQSQFKDLKTDKKLFETQNASKLDSTDITKLPPPRTSTFKKGKRSKRKQSRSRSPFDNISRYDNLFEPQTTYKPETDRNDTTNTTEHDPVTMDQIVALPIPPKTKPKPIKRTKKEIAIASDIVCIANDNEISNDSLPSPPTVKVQQKQRKSVVIKSKKKKKKHYHRKKQQQQSMRSKKQKRNYRNKQIVNNNKDNNVESDGGMAILPVLNHMVDTDWYQIIKSDSSDDDRNMSTEDAEKLDMLESI